MFNFNANTTISTTTTTSTSTSTTTTITNTMNNNNMNRRTRQRVEWSEEEIRLLINQRRHRNLEYYRTPGRSRTAFWNSVARRINRSAGSNFTGNQCKRKFKNLVTMYNVSKIIKIKGNIYILK